MIQIGGNWYLDSEPDCFIVKEKYISKGDKHAGKEMWRNESYFANHEQVIREIGDIALKEALTHDIKAMVELLQGFREKFDEFVKFKR